MPSIIPLNSPTAPAAIARGGTASPMLPRIASPIFGAAFTFTDWATPGGCRSLRTTSPRGLHSTRKIGRDGNAVPGGPPHDIQSHRLFDRQDARVAGS